MTPALDLVVNGVIVVQQIMFMSPRQCFLEDVLVVGRVPSDDDVSIFFDAAAA